MSFDPVSQAVESVFDLGKVAIEKIWPDETKRAEELRKLEALRQEGDLARLNAHVQIMVEQIRVNREQAKHKSLFVAGARPAAIWAGVFAMVWTGIIHPFLTWVWAFQEMTGQPPALTDSSSLFTLTLGLLGVGAMRSFDKSKGVQTDAIGR